MASVVPYFPQDQLTGDPLDVDLAADYMELSAWLSEVCYAATSNLVDAMEIGAEVDYEDVDDELTIREELKHRTIDRLAERRSVLDDTYPFLLDEGGDLLYYQHEELTIGQGSYLVCLLLSNLRAISPMLDGTNAHPDSKSIHQLRLWFQYFATAALAAEVNGRAWSFGHPRPNHTGFLTKLTEVYTALNDGRVEPARGAPKSAKDDQVDVFAVRQHADALPGYLFAAAQVATGADWRGKSLVGHMQQGFFDRWFGEQPSTRPLVYHIVPFAREDDALRDDVRTLGNLLHRTRLPSRVSEAGTLVEAGMEIEAYDQLAIAVDWISRYRARHVGGDA